MPDLAPPDPRAPLRVDADDPDPALIAEAAAALRAGRLVAFPTETVYGLGAAALDGDAVARVFAAKGRPADNPLIVHVADANRLDALTRRVTPLAADLADRFWPGPLTLVVDADPSVPGITTGGLATVAVRVPAHPVALALLRAADIPVAAPSANRSGRPSPTTAAHVLADLGALVDVVVDGGPCRVGVESTVVDARGDHAIVLRDGAVTREALGLADTRQGSAVPADLAASPGTRHRHYAPACRVVVAAPGAGADAVAAEVAAGRRVATLGVGPLRMGPLEAVPLGTAPIDAAGVVDLGPAADAAELAVRLYGALRAAEAAGVDVVVVQGVPEHGLGRAVMDRLRRAAAGSQDHVEVTTP